MLHPTIHILFEHLGKPWQASDNSDEGLLYIIKIQVNTSMFANPGINSKSIKWKWKVDMKSFRKYGFIRKLRTHMVYSLQDHANCVVCYIQYMTPSHHLTSKHYSWWYIVSNTRIWPGKKAVATREPCRGGHDLGMNISTSSLDHNPIFWTHHEKVTCWNEVKQQHICAFFLSWGPEKRRHKKVKSSHQVKQSEAHPPSFHVMHTRTNKRQQTSTEKLMHSK